MENLNGVIEVEVWVISFLFFKFEVFVLDGGNLWRRGVSILVLGFGLILGLVLLYRGTSILLALSLLFQPDPSFLLFLKPLLLFRAKLVEGVNKELYVIH